MADFGRTQFSKNWNESSYVSIFVSPLNCLTNLVNSLNSNWKTSIKEIDHSCLFGNLFLEVDVIKISKLIWYGMLFWQPASTKLKLIWLGTVTCKNHNGHVFRAVQDYYEWNN